MKNITSSLSDETLFTLAKFAGLDEEGWYERLSSPLTLGEKKLIVGELFELGYQKFEEKDGFSRAIRPRAKK